MQVESGGLPFISHINLDCSTVTRLQMGKGEGVTRNVYKVVDVIFGHSMNISVILEYYVEFTSVSMSFLYSIVHPM